MNVGLVGLGEMGMPILERLRAAGHDVSFRARRPEVIAHAAGLGARPAADFADRDTVITCVFSTTRYATLGPASWPRCGQARRWSTTPPGARRR